VDPIRDVPDPLTAWCRWVHGWLAKRRDWGPKIPAGTFLVPAASCVAITDENGSNTDGYY